LEISQHDQLVLLELLLLLVQRPALLEPLLELRHKLAEEVLRLGLDF
jgi:hypothetical protein